MNKNITKLLILIITAGFSGIEVYGDVTAEQMLRTSSSPAVAVEKTASSIETGTIDPLNGSHGILRSVFTLQTNGTDEDYDFVITSSIPTTSGEASAYGADGCILFANTLNLPTSASVNDAKEGGNNNNNVIAYPVNITVTNPLSVSFQPGKYNGCYQVLLNAGDNGQIIHNIGSNPVSGTYNVGQDVAGTYQATVTFTAVSKN